MLIGFQISKIDQIGTKFNQSKLFFKVYELELRWKRISLKSQPIIAVTLKIKTKGMDSFE